jgi:hypothetical protein
MDVFVVFRVKPRDGMEAAIRRLYADSHYALPDGVWLIASSETAKQIGEKLGVGTPDLSAMIFKMGGYYGRAPTEIWDWIKAKAEASGEK